MINFKIVSKALAIGAVMFVSACKVEPQPGRWEEVLNSYMAERGYTMADDAETILKDGYPVWIDEYCVGRGCFNTNRPLVPVELQEGVRQDFFAALVSARKEYVEDISEKIGIKPVAPKVTAGEEQ